MPATSPFAADLLSASGRSAEKLNLPTLQDKMKRDPESYESELTAIQVLFDSSLELFKQQAALSFSSISGIAPDSTIAKDLSDRTMFLAHMAPFYPKRLSHFPNQLAEFLMSSAKSLPSGLRLEVTKALILLMNRKMADIRDALALFMELQTLGDKVLRNLAFDHVVHTIRRMNKKSKNQTMNRALQKIMFETLKQDDEVKAKRALITLRELHRRKVWFDDETSNAICRACLHPSSRVMIAALSFLLDYEKIEDDTDSDESSDEDELAKMPTVISKEAIYKANNKGTVASKKKKKAKLQRAMRSMKKQQRLSSEKTNTNYYSPLSYLIDPQGFAEKLFSRLQNSNERFEVKMMVLKVVARTIGLHRLILLNFYPYLQNYAKPHQRDVTTVLASAVQACHDMVPPDTVEPLFRQIVNQFVHDKSRPESIAVGLNVVREICLRIPSLMTEELLQDLVLYKKTHEKAVSTAARSLVSLFREICPSMLAKKDRGRPNDLKAKPKAYGESSVAENVPGLELLENDDGADSSDNDSDDDMNIEKLGTSDNEENEALSFNSGSEDDDECNDDDTEHAGEDDTSSFGGDIGEAIGDDDDDDDEDGSDVSEEEDDDSDEEDENVQEDGSENSKSKTKKRKFSDFDKQLISGDSSLRALKKLGASLSQVPTDSNEDGILSNEDFKRIKELKAKKDAKSAMFKHGLLGKGADAKSSAFKVLNADQLSSKRVDPAKLEAHVRQKLNKEERLALVRAGREDRGKYTARAAVKQKKTGGMSNKQKEHKKAMPIAAKRAKIARSRNQKGKKQSGKQFRGKKAWK